MGHKKLKVRVATRKTGKEEKEKEERRSLEGKSGSKDTLANDKAGSLTRATVTEQLETREADT